MILSYFFTQITILICQWVCFIRLEIMVVFTTLHICIIILTPVLTLTYLDAFFISRNALHILK